MCGLVGFWSDLAEVGAESGMRCLRAMARSIAHRGPDSEGYWLDEKVGVALAHRRLAILDPSPAGAQPMASDRGRYMLVFNGEIYNHLALRKRLEAESGAPCWRGHSDTETVLAAIERWGIQDTLKQLVGMFAMAVWDRQRRRLTLARDRMGEKPLYYGRIGKNFVFASEIKALCKFPGFDDDIDRVALTTLLRYSSIPAPRTIYSKIRKLPPAHSLTIDQGALRDGTDPTPYWSLQNIVLADARIRSPGPFDELADGLETLLVDVVRSQMLSDVPIGAFLSGGVDSSLVAALMCASRPAHRVRTFSIGFGSQRFDEAAHARRVASHLGTDHSDLVVTEKDALAVVPDLPRLFDEPFADPSAIPTVLLCQMTRRTVKVALSGDGGDEVFGGYNRHVMAPFLWRNAARIPAPVRRGLEPFTAVLQRMAMGDRAAVLATLATWLGLPVTTADKLAKFGSALACSDTFEAFYRELLSTWSNPSALTGHACRPDAALDPRILSSSLSKSEQLMALDALCYLPDDILVKVDRSAMSVGLETRAPYLDLRVVDAAWQLPIDAKICGSTSKRILRAILYKHVPRELLDRPKHGFAVPIDDWLRGSLRDWAESLLSPSAVRNAGLFDPKLVERVWAAHVSGSENAGSRLWAILMAQAWHATSRSQPEQSRSHAAAAPVSIAPAARCAADTAKAGSAWRPAACLATDGGVERLAHRKPAAFWSVWPWRFGATAWTSDHCVAAAQLLV